MASMDGVGWPDLAEAVKNRRLELGLSVRAAADTAGINRATWASFEDGSRRLRQVSWSAVERTLGWAPGSIARIIDGGSPRLATTAPPVRSGVDETIELVRSDDRLSNEMKVRIIGLIHERREREREAERAETQRMIEIMRDAG